MASNSTNNLDIKFMSQSQEQKEAVFNDAILKLDVINSCLMNDPIVGDRNPPINAPFGLYVVAGNSQGDWNGYSGYLAYYLEGWKFIKPKDGLILFHKPSTSIYVFYDNIWHKKV
jgi:hypothetical protein